MKPIKLPENHFRYCRDYAETTPAAQRARAVKELSDFYIQHPEAATPWGRSQTKKAYLSYFHPMNLLRLIAVRERLADIGFLKGISNLHDFGAGLGAASWAFFDVCKKDIYAYEKAQKPKDLFLKEGIGRLHWPVTLPQPQSEQDILIAAYSMTELTQLPEWVYSFPKVLIVEPSTHQDSRRLGHYRDLLIKHGYHIWAPCPHQQNCPLLKSRKDWCHDRAHVERPYFLTELDRFLPFKNKTLTMSYIAAQKAPSPLQNAARLVGDALVEKGKTRQMICRDSDRRFVSWLHRTGRITTLNRGDLVIDPFQPSEQDQHELRCSQPLTPYKF